MKAVVELSAGEVLGVSVFEKDDDALGHAYGLCVENEEGTAKGEVMRSLRVQSSYSIGDWCVQIADVRNAEFLP
jgi:hypothetical protein